MPPRNRLDSITEEPALEPERGMTRKASLNSLKYSEVTVKINVTENKDACVVPSEPSDQEENVDSYWDYDETSSTSLVGSTSLQDLMSRAKEEMPELSQLESESVLECGSYQVGREDWPDTMLCELLVSDSQRCKRVLLEDGRTAYVISVRNQAKPKEDGKCLSSNDQYFYG
ncbi:hypothetical protein THAOC_03849 [Thalassiosira oceanica]|uniref:Uncharacterized protein n=1 Tax=Thalassiosira oceanica TaxID=159749 RepID=K0TPH1_THAOC|nr:hypothetical protein THAOC_03849 [Thalassiosira oceanica]|eukprot:EJK74467.1 hypothetical protein THAOC_03849 [Thalassiosira oceanica]